MSETGTQFVQQPSDRPLDDLTMDGRSIVVDEDSSGDKERRGVGPFSWDWAWWMPVAAVVLVYAQYQNGADAVVRQHDHLDAYQAVFSQVSLGDLFALPGRRLEFMLGGLQREFVGSEFHIGNLLTVLVPTMWAMALNELIIRCLAFFSMTLLLRAMRIESRAIVFATATLFSLIPFYLPAFGAVAGFPLLLSALVWIYDTGRLERRSVIVFGGFSFYSALPFNVPYVIVLAGLIGMVVLFRRRAPWWPMLQGVAFYAVVSAITGWRFLYLSLAGPVSHRSEMVVERQWSASLWSGVGPELTTEGQHTPMGRTVLLALVLVAGALCVIARGGAMTPRLRIVAVFGVLGVLGGIAFSRVWPIAESDLVALILDDWGRLQLSRVRWVEPTIVYVLVAIAATAIVGSTANRVGTAVLASLLSAATLVQAASLVSAHTFRAAPDSPSVREYYSLRTFSQVRDAIENESGGRAVSIGFHPAVAIYNGIESADGYWNGYPLDYKHRFRRLIAPALDLVPADRSYFDRWGSRVYVFQPDVRRPGCCEPSHDPVTMVIDREALGDLEVTHLISAGPIDNVEENRLTLVGEFDHPGEIGPVYLYSFQLAE